MQKIWLASGSPRRRELLTQLAVNFDVIKIDVDESQLGNETASAYVERLAKAKAQAGFVAGGAQLPALGADTIVVVDGQVLGKPTDQTDFMRMMRLLQNRSHQVLTAVAIQSAAQLVHTTVCTDVWFGPMTEADMLAYWQSGEPADKAGGYGIQGLAGRFIEKIHGSYFAVVGLPLFETAALLAQIEQKGLA
ncbi:MAG TPA: septum formation inhibitor Maf [Rheinheimera sp.]|nr:septum formation inhibitor Maf [Rheinheimera sp.]